ncbi:DUF6314 family protein [Flaviflagellibacter deserti]|jgi:hypothetical protein|uniref:DUF6314 family protein n=1 Tax=Flaviflagellibacter deserti TaxID=2267266 RepID=A0ABV9Z5B8_9HYPH
MLDVVEGLEGNWSIARTIDPEGSLAGVATFFRRTDGWLAYFERGELKVAGGSYPAERRYLFEPLTNGFAVWFDAEPLRLFHKIALIRSEDGSLTGEATHPCGRDMYLTTYRFAGDGFTIRHRVTGPNKNYTMTTAYTRRTDKRIAA